MTVAALQEVNPDINICYDSPASEVRADAFTVYGALNAEGLSNFLSLDPAELDLWREAIDRTHGYCLIIWPHEAPDDYREFTKHEEDMLVSQAGADKPQVSYPEDTLLQIAEARSKIMFLPAEITVDKAVRPERDYAPLCNRLNELRIQANRRQKTERELGQATLVVL